MGGASQEKVWGGGGGSPAKAFHFTKKKTQFGS